MADDAALPAQATGNTLPGQAAIAADMNDIAPAPSAEDALLAANFGDQGAQQYRDLRAAGQQAPMPAAVPQGAGLAALAGLPAQAPAPVAPAAAPPAAPVAAPGANALDPIAAMLMGGKNFAAVEQQRAKSAQLQQQEAKQAQAAASTDLDFLDKLRTNNVPLDLRAGVIQDYMARQGRQVSSVQAAYIAHISKDPELLKHLQLRLQQGDPNAFAEYQGLFSGDPMQMATADSKARESKANADRAVMEVEQLQAKQPYFGREAAADVRSKEAGAQHAELGNTTFYDTPERQAQAEATAKNLKPGDTRFTDYINHRVAALKQDQQLGTEVSKIKAQIANKPLPAFLQRQVSEAQDADDIATDLKALYSDPTVLGNRQALSQRVGDLMKYRLGVELPAGTDSAIALQSLLDIAASTQFLHGIRNPQYIKDYVMAHMPKTQDPPDRVLNKIEIMQRFARRRIKNAYDLGTSPAGERQAEQERPIPGIPGAAPSASSYTDPQKLKADAASGTIDRATAESIARQNHWIQ